jgi:phosphate transport system permease protein
VFKFVFKITGFLVLALLGGILTMLIYNSVSFFLDIRPLDFITGMEWNPTGKDPQFGMLPLIISTTLVTFGAMLIAIPIGIGTAAFISEYAGARIKNILKPTIEMLAAVPSVVIGFLGIVVVSPSIAGMADLPNGLNALNGAILLAVMALPTIITVAEDAIHAVPRAYKEASYGLGATKWSTAKDVAQVLGKSGICYWFYIFLGLVCFSVIVL